MVLHPNAHNLLGQRFGRLVVVAYGGSHRGTRWECRCDCGTMKTVQARNLATGTTRSCGCLYRGQHRTHGETIGGRTGRYSLWVEAKRRAKKKGLLFNLQVSDIVIPELCPLLGMRLCRHIGPRGPKDDSPSLDRRDSRLGYVVGNVWVISNRANRLKSNATVEELEGLTCRLRWVTDTLAFTEGSARDGCVYRLCDLAADAQAAG